MCTTQHKLFLLFFSVCLFISFASLNFCVICFRFEHTTFFVCKKMHEKSFIENILQTAKKDDRRWYCVLYDSLWMLHASGKWNRFYEIFQYSFWILLVLQFYQTRWLPWWTDASTSWKLPALSTFLFTAFLWNRVQTMFYIQLKRKHRQSGVHCWLNENHNIRR